MRVNVQSDVKAQGASVALDGVLVLSRLLLMLLFLFEGQSWQAFTQ